ncbi:MAG: 3-deoxy-manno-octulosonate cytidylyltransferase [Candidatus Coatesbacteria bacterium]|nr:MAG: 3-deoxy-manno-octulosonate cytidylyltransferase [Candidatus Coatesbacteria bacterium]
MKVVGVIPVRYASSRFPGKALADIAGKPMVQHVYERCAACERLDRLYVATDDQRIYDAARVFTDDVVMTSGEHESGTDRVAEVVEGIDGDVFVNVQGDEPLIEPAAVEALIRPFEEDPDVNMTTLARPAGDRTEVSSPNTCKVVINEAGDALYFSRAAIPHYRETQPEQWYLLHVGTYAFRRDFLLTFARLEKRPLEIAEGLEMLRALEHGYKVGVVVGPFVSLGVDTEDDLERVRELIERNT